MIRPLRQRHRIMVFALSVVVPTAFAVGIVTRRSVPALAVTVPSLAKEVRNLVERWSRDDLWEKKAIHTRLLSIDPAAGQLAVEIGPAEHIVWPDVLVYWIPGKHNIQDSLPDDAFLLGSFEQSSPIPLALPDAAKKQTGALALYSLANQEIVAVSKSFVAQ